MLSVSRLKVGTGNNFAFHQGHGKDTDLRDVLSVDPDDAAIEVIKAEQQANDGAFSAAGVTNLNRRRKKKAILITLIIIIIIIILLLITLIIMMRIILLTISMIIIIIPSEDTRSSMAVDLHIR